MPCILEDVIAPLDRGRSTLIQSATFWMLIICWTKDIQILLSVSTRKPMSSRSVNVFNTNAKTLHDGTGAKWEPNTKHNWREGRRKHSGLEHQKNLPEEGTGTQVFSRWKASQSLTSATLGFPPPLSHILQALIRAEISSQINQSAPKEIQTDTTSVRVDC